MPKFLCIHCGKYIDASELIGMHPNCPTCGGAISAPGQQVQQPPPLPTTFQDKSGSGGFWGIVSTAISLIVCVTAGVAAKSCARGAIPNQSSRTSYSETPAPPSTEALTFYDVAGLRIKLPSRPILENIKLPPEAAKLMRTFQSYKVDYSGAMIEIVYMAYNIPEVNLDGSADGSISQVRSLPSVTNFFNTKSVVTVSGLKGRQIFISARHGSHQIAQHGLVFVRGSEAWQVQVIGTSTHESELESLSDSIFSSITVTN
jgi:hypothetical protein